MPKATDHRNSSGVHRAPYSNHCASYAEMVAGARIGRGRDAALEGYFDAESALRKRPSNDNRRVYRSVKSPANYDCYNSTSFRYVDVSLPRVSFIDGVAA